MVFGASPDRRHRQEQPVVGLTLRAKVLWTLGSALLLLGMVLLLYAGGLYAQAEYLRYAARGDTDAPPPRAVARPVSLVAPGGQDEPAPFSPPVLITASTSGQIVAPISTTSRLGEPSTVSRLIIPSIGVDSKVIEVGWEIVEQNGQQIAVWQVAEYAVGHHRGSANPGAGGNIVMAGHVGGYGKVFKDLYDVQPGDPITVYNRGQQYLYVVQERLVVDEEGVSAEQQAANARYIEPTDEEILTLVTCWPASGPNKFSQRVIVRAVPYRVDSAPQAASLSQWSAR